MSPIEATVQRHPGLALAASFSLVTLLLSLAPWETRRLVWKPDLGVAFASYTTDAPPVTGPPAYLQSETIDPVKQRKELDAYRDEVRRWEDAKTYVDIPGLTFWRRPRVHVDGYHYVRDGTVWAAQMHFWPFIAICLIAPVTMGRAVRRTARALRWRAAGRCDACGYDLRGGQKRCPECGREVTPTDVHTLEPTGGARPS